MPIRLGDMLAIGLGICVPLLFTILYVVHELPRAVYDALIKSTNEHLPTLHRYFRLRAKMLGVEEMRYYDIYPPLVSLDRPARPTAPISSTPATCCMKRTQRVQWMQRVMIVLISGPMYFSVTARLFSS